MADTSLIYNSVDQSGKKYQKALTDVNPNAEPAALKNFAQSLNNLTTNTYGGSTRVIKTNLDEESPASTKAQRTIQMFKMDADWNNIIDTVTAPINFNSLPELTDGAGQAYIVAYEGDSQTPCQYLFDNKTFENFQAVFIGYPIYGYAGGRYGRVVDMIRDADMSLSAGKSANVTIHVDEDDTYQAADFVVTIQGGNA